MQKYIIFVKWIVSYLIISVYGCVFLLFYIIFAQYMLVCVVFSTHNVYGSKSESNQEKQVMKVTASIVTYNTDGEELDKCICSMLDDGVEKVYVSDNSENDSLRSLCEGRDKVEYVFNGANLGYGAGHNVAIRKAQKEGTTYHLVINADVYFDKGVIPALTEYMDTNQDVAMAHPKVLYPNGELQYTVRLLPSPKTLIFRRFMSPAAVEEMNYTYLLKFADHDKEMNVPYHQGSFMFFRVSCFDKVGMFDERFFLYPEDIDITRRMHKHYRTMYFPKVSVIHKHMQASYKSKEMLKVHMINMIKYFNKWGWIFDGERVAWNKRIIAEYSQNK